MIEEGVYNIKPEDYNEQGELKEEVAVLADFIFINNNLPSE